MINDNLERYVLDSAESISHQRLHVVDAALGRLAEVVPPSEPVKEEAPTRTISNVVNLEERRQQAGLNAHQHLLNDSRYMIDQQFEDRNAA